LWDGEAIRVDRKGRPGEAAPVYVPHPFVAIVGGVQPSVLPLLRGEPRRGQPPPGDGFFGRVLLRYPAGRPDGGEPGPGVSEEASRDWEVVMERLLALPLYREENGEERPLIVGLSSGGKEAWKAFTEGHAAELNDPDFPEFLRGPWAKLRGYGGRLALIVHELRRACAGFTELIPAEVGGASMRHAVLLVNYFKGHARRGCSAPPGRPPPPG